MEDLRLFDYHAHGWDGDVHGLALPQTALLQSNDELSTAGSIAKMRLLTFSLLSQPPWWMLGMAERKPDPSLPATG